MLDNLPALFSRRLVTNGSLAHSVIAKLHFSSLGYMGGASGGDNNYTRHHFRS
jgi:hypothetical protein